MRRQPNQVSYRRSRGGKRLIGCIFGIVKKHQLQGKIRQVDYNNLTTITISEVSLSRWINLAHINARSVCNKRDQIQEQIVTNNLDLCVITETWIKQDDSMMAKEILPPGYNVSSLLTKETGQGAVQHWSTRISLMWHKLLLLCLPPWNVAHMVFDLEAIVSNYISSTDNQRVVCCPSVKNLLHTWKMI